MATYNAQCLWIYTVITILEMAFCLAHVFGKSLDVWNKYGMLCYFIWSVAGIIASLAGIYGIIMKEVTCLERSIQYYLCSAIIKLILTLPLPFSRDIDKTFDAILVSAACGPILFMGLHHMILIIVVHEMNSDILRWAVIASNAIVIAFNVFMACNLTKYKNRKFPKNPTNRPNTTSTQPIRPSSSDQNIELSPM